MQKTDFDELEEGAQFPIGHKDDEDFVGVKENGELVVYSGPAVDDAETPEDHLAKIVADGKKVTTAKLKKINPGLVG